ncbi:MAG: NAD(P)H-dependent oxidoreductase [Deltaproteobacteria bacterium]|jgi:multimeric flavodoxin WrbA|nr:NAD(P)H-dependent oxidoreductase [Deltaproteobacteria bacterium]
MSAAPVAVRQTHKVPPPYSGQPFVLAASPRAGNCLEAARVFCAAFNRHFSLAGGKNTPLAPVLLRDYRVLPCAACGLCEHPASACPQAAADDSRALFASFLNAPLLALAAPVYFYHLPAQLKALLDRCQFYYRAAERGELILPRRKAFIILLGAREKGTALFKGSLLSLSLALAPFNLHMAAPLLLRGLDGPGDLLQRADCLEQIKAYGKTAAAVC